MEYINTIEVGDTVRVVNPNEATLDAYSQKEIDAFGDGVVKAIIEDDEPCLVIFDSEKKEWFDFDELEVMSSPSKDLHQAMSEVVKREQLGLSLVEEMENWLRFASNGREVDGYQFWKAMGDVYVRSKQ